MAPPTETSSLPPRPQYNNNNNNKKKTREKPNLSDCHCCKQRFMTTNPKNKLQTLVSEWRIVLLCKSCYKLVESSKYCSYCFSEIVENCSCCECKRCHRKVHRSCVGDDDGDGDGGEFDVCFDCWMPRLIEMEYNRVRVEKMLKRRRGSLGGNVDGVCGEEGEEEGEEGRKKASLEKKAAKEKGVKKKEKSGLENGRVGGEEGRRKMKKGELSMEEVVKEANDEVKTRKEVAVEAKEKALNKVVVARRAVALASGALGVVGVGKDGEGMVMEEDDVQLAIRLHRAMNSSPRISRGLCGLSGNCVDVPRVEKSVDGSDGVDVPRVEKSVDGPVSVDVPRVEKNVGGPDGVDGVVCGLHAPGEGRIEGLSKSAVEGKQSKEDCAQKPGGTEEKKGNESCWNGCLITYSRRGRGSQDVEAGAGSFFRKHSKKPLLEERRNWEQGHCQYTYSRRHPTMPRCKTKLLFNLEHGILTPAVALNSSVESRTLTNAS